MNRKVRLSLEITAGLILAVAVAAAMLVGGCATAQQDTMLAEFALSSQNSFCFHVIDGIDAMKTASIHAKLANGDEAGANQDYATYKPKIEKARAVCNASDDTVQNAEKERLKIPVGGDARNYTAWLPALAQAAALVTQAIADVKGIVK
jgi:hypothetical protein